QARFHPPAEPLQLVIQVHPAADGPSQHQGNEDDDNVFGTHRHGDPHHRHHQADALHHLNSHFLPKTGQDKAKQGAEDHRQSVDHRSQQSHEWFYLPLFPYQSKAFRISPMAMINASASFSSLKYPKLARTAPVSSVPRLL